MKLLRVTIKNFKGIDEIDFELTSEPEQPRPLTALIGGNGSGKTSILQAIALTLSMATRRTRSISDFQWHGFLPERMSSLGPTYIELVLSFDEEEIALTKSLYDAWEASLPTEKRQTKKLVPPATHKTVTIRYEKGTLRSPQGFEALNQFLGRFYIKVLQQEQPTLQSQFAKLGDVFWFDQQRNLGSVLFQGDNGYPSAKHEWQAGVEQLREYLVGWWGHHTTASRRGKDFINPLQEKFQALFPGSKFIGIMPRPDVNVPRASDFYFLIEDKDHRVYDLAEMSSGEQAVFPIIYEFVRLDISRSIVLIDELELHLHPPEQQRLLASLPAIGPDCQFIITTHSEYLTSAIPDEQEIRLERGVRCL